MTADFWKTWGDGHAEVASYSLISTGAGQPEKGTATVITAVEPFSKTLRVRADSSTHPKPDITQALRLSIAKTNSMLTAYVWLEGATGQPEGMPAKVSFSSQNQCRHSWSQLLFGPASARQTRHGDIDGDVQRTLTVPPNSTSEDVLLLAARRFAWPGLRLGQTYAVPFLTSLEAEQARHLPLAWSNLELTLGKDRQTTTVPAGHFRTNLFTAKWPDKREKRIEVQADPPFQIIRWTSSNGEVAELIEAGRTKLC